MNLKEKSLKALIWSLIDSFGIYFVRFGFSIVIIRKLEPRDYGLVGMISFFTALAAIISESGLSMALISKKDSTQKDFSTIFYFNLITAVILYVVFFMSSGLIAHFYNEPVLKDMTRLLALSIILGSLMTVHITILSKSLEFKSQALINMSSALVSGILGVIFVYNGYGVWAIVYSGLISSFLSVILFWFSTKWRPMLTFSFSSLKSLYKYGVNIFVQGLTSILFDQIYYPFIGRYYNATQLGLFINAEKFYHIFVRRVTIAYGRVSFPTFVQFQDDFDRFNDYYRKTAIALAFVLIPFTTFLIVSAKPLILVLLTEKWARSILWLQIFYFDGFIFPFLLLNQNALNALGKSKLSLIIDITKKTFLIFGLLVAVKIGIEALIVNQVIGSLIGFLYSIYILKKNIRVEKMFADILPIVCFSAVCAIPSYFLDSLITNNFIILFLQLVIFSLYIFLSKITKQIGYFYFISFIRPIIPASIFRYF